MTRIDIQTADGVCPPYLFRPSGAGPGPGAIVYMDGVGIRPAMLAVGERLATHGFFALLPDLFSRAGPYEPMDPKEIFTKPELIQALREKFFAHVSQAKVMSD